MKILLVEDHGVVREGVRRLISLHFDVTIFEQLYVKKGGQLSSTTLYEMVVTPVPSSFNSSSVSPHRILFLITGLLFVVLRIPSPPAVPDVLRLLFSLKVTLNSSPGGRSGTSWFVSIDLLNNS